jgi:hypothetical protein
MLKLGYVNLLKVLGLYSKFMDGEKQHLRAGYLRVSERCELSHFGVHQGTQYAVPRCWR